MNFAISRHGDHTRNNSIRQRDDQSETQPGHAEGLLGGLSGGCRGDGPRFGPDRMSAVLLR